MRIGSLFSGYGGLDLGVMEALGGTVAWHAEFEEAPSRILAHHWPNVPNLGDVTRVEWSAVEPVDVICGGSPCQDVSMAGARKGMRAGTRSGLWASMCDAIETIRPALVVWENVRGALSAGADSNVEPCPICVGDGPATHLRALGRVLGDLAELGYDAGWEVVRASDVGAPHRRERVFVLAHAADANAIGRERLRKAWEWRYGLADYSSKPVTNAGRGDGREGNVIRAEFRGNRARGISVHRDGYRQADPGGHCEACGGIDPDCASCELYFHRFGQFAWVVRRWERVTGYPAPDPTIPGPSDEFVSHFFVEWMMGLTPGHVTGVPGITRGQALKALGNGVVPQQAAHAIRRILEAS